MYSHEYTDKDQREYERFAAMCAQQGMQGHEKFVGPCALYLKFYFEVPKSRARKIQEGDWHPQRPDRDNCEIALLRTDMFSSPFTIDNSLSTAGFSPFLT